jgi:hypothetical protein
MSDPKKPEELDLVRGWLFVEGLLIQEEAERLDNLSDEEFERELKAKGRELGGGLPDAEELLARLAKRVQAESADKVSGTQRTVHPAPEPDRLGATPEVASQQHDEADGKPHRSQ